MRGRNFFFSPVVYVSLILFVMACQCLAFSSDVTGEGSGFICSHVRADRCYRTRVRNHDLVIFFQMLTRFGRGHYKTTGTKKTKRASLDNNAVKHYVGK